MESDQSARAHRETFGAKSRHSQKSYRPLEKKGEMGSKDGIMSDPTETFDFKIAADLRQESLESEKCESKLWPFVPSSYLPTNNRIPANSARTPIA
jgi:hypothetical protein